MSGNKRCCMRCTRKDSNLQAIPLCAAPILGRSCGTDCAKSASRVQSAISIAEVAITYEENGASELVRRAWKWLACQHLWLDEAVPQLAVIHLEARTVRQAQKAQISNDRVILPTVDLNPVVVAGQLELGNLAAQPLR